MSRIQERQVRLKSGDECAIRSVSVDDAQFMIHHLQTVGGETDFLTYGPDDISLDVAKERSLVEEVLTAPNRVFLICEIDGNIAGTLGFHGEHRPRTQHTGQFGIAVKKQFWGRGVGRALICAMLEWARQGGFIRKVNARVRPDNSRALALYTSMGFEREGVVSREYLINGGFYDNVLMGLEL